MKVKLSLIIAVLAAVASAASADSPAAAGAGGQIGTPSFDSAPPPATPRPSNEFKLGRAKRRGLVVALEVTIPYPGRLAASGKGLKKLRVTRHKVGTFTVKLRLTDAGLDALRGSRNRRLKVEVAFVFTPSGGVSRAKTREITFRS